MSYKQITCKCGKKVKGEYSSFSDLAIEYNWKQDKNYFICPDCIKPEKKEKNIKKESEIINEIELD